MNYIKFLVVLLDEHLAGKYHIAELSKKLAKTCGIFSRSGICFQHPLWSHYIMPCSWPFYNKALFCGVKHLTHIEPLFKLQKRAVRAISHQPFLAHSLPIFNDLKLLRIVDIFNLTLLSFVYESVNMVAPVCFHNFFLLNSTLHCHNTRQSTCGDLPLANIKTSQYGLKSIQYLGAQVWNELPIAIKTSPSKFTFKKSLKFYILNAM